MAAQRARARVQMKTTEKITYRNPVALLRTRDRCSSALCLIVRDISDRIDEYAMTMESTIGEWRERERERSSKV